MANNPYKNKVVYNGTTLIDLTGDTVTPDKLLLGYTAHDASGKPIVGTAPSGGGGAAISIVDTTDSHGGIIREITAVSLGNDTVAPENLLAGYTAHDATGQAIVGTASGGSTKNIQAYIGRASRTANSYGATDVTLTVAKTGTYNVSWTAWRSSSSGTMGTNLYVNSTSGTNQQTWTSTYGQQIELTNQSYTAGDVLTLYATSGSNSRTINVANLIIEEQ